MWRSARDDKREWLHVPGQHCSVGFIVSRSDAASCSINPWVAAAAPGDAMKLSVAVMIPGYVQPFLFIHRFA